MEIFKGLMSENITGLYCPYEKTDDGFIFKSHDFFSFSAGPNLCVVENLIKPNKVEQGRYDKTIAVHGDILKIETEYEKILVMVYRNTVFTILSYYRMSSEPSFEEIIEKRAEIENHLERFFIKQYLQEMFKRTGASEPKNFEKLVTSVHEEFKKGNLYGQYNLVYHNVINCYITVLETKLFVN